MVLEEAETLIIAVNKINKKRFIGHKVLFRLLFRNYFPAFRRHPILNKVNQPEFTSLLKLKVTLSLFFLPTKIFERELFSFLNIILLVFVPTTLIFLSEQPCSVQAVIISGDKVNEISVFSKIFIRFSFSLVSLIFTSGHLLCLLMTACSLFPCKS